MKNKAHIAGVEKGWGIACRTLLVALVMLLWAAPAALAYKPAGYLPEATCTNQPQFEIDHSSAISDLASNIISTISTNSSSMFNNVANGIGDTVMIAVELYIVIWGCLYMFGAAEMSFYDFVTRIAKLSVVHMAVSGGSSMHSLLTNVFDDTTQVLINKIGCTMSGSGCSGENASIPLSFMDGLFSTLISPKMIVTLMTIATTGVYGPLIALLIVMSLKSIGEALLNGLWVYIISSIIRGILISVAPLFIPCILFSRTRELFQGWLNQLVGSCLQPIFLIAFFAFFIGLVEVSINNIISVPICLTPMVNIANGAAVNGYWWRFTKGGEQFTGDWGPNDGFPLDVFNIFLLFILAELVGRFNSSVISMANSISGASFSSSAVAGVFSSWEGMATGGSPVTVKPGEKSADAQRRITPDKIKEDSTSGDKPGVGRRPSTGGELPPQSDETVSRHGDSDPHSHAHAHVPAGVGAASASTAAARGRAPSKRETGADSYKRAIERMQAIRRNRNLEGN